MTPAELIWHPTRGRTPPLEPTDLIFVKGRLGDVFGPLPVEIVSLHAWQGNMLHGSNDVVAYALAVEGGAAQGIVTATADETPQAAQSSEVRPGAGLP